MKYKISLLFGDYIGGNNGGGTRDQAGSNVGAITEGFATFDVGDDKE